MNLDTDISILRDELDYLRTKKFDDDVGGLEDGEQQQIEAYKVARDVFLYRKSIDAMVERIGQGSGVNKTADDTVDEQEVDELKKEAEEAIEEAAQLASSIQESLVLLKTKQSYGIVKSDEIGHLIIDSQLENGMMDVGEEEIDEEAAAVAEQELIRLRKKRAEAQIRLQFLQNEKSKADHTLQDIIASNPGLSRVGMEQKIDALDKENRALRATVEEKSNTEQHFDQMMQIITSMSGIRLLDIDGNRDETCVTLKIRVRLLDKYNQCFIVETKGLESTILKDASFYPVHPTILGPDDDDTVQVQLLMPPLDTVMSAASSMSHKDSGDSVRFFLIEVRTRLQALELRAEELNALQRVATTKIGPLEAYGQQVVCSLNHAQLTLVMHLDVGCPLLMGSVRLQKLVGYGGWDKLLLDSIEEDLHSKKWQSPVALMERCKAIVQDLQKEHGAAVVPNTPRLPLNAMWAS